MIPIRRMEPMRGRAIASGMLGVVCLGATALGALGNTREALHGYLFAFVFWLSLSLGALFALTMFHSTSARWPVVLRRPLEWMGLSCVLCLPLFLPIVLGAGQLFPWVDTPAGLGERAVRLIAHKAPYLNRPFFLLRAVFYYAVWGTLAYVLHRWSARQDKTGDLRLTQWQRRLSAGALPLLAITVSFASLDWIMSLEPLWSSTMFGLYVFTGAVVASLAAILLLAATGRDPHSFGAFMTAAHYQRLGTLLLAFICLWAYCAYSQAMLIWIAGLPHESTWYLKRTQEGWRAVALAIVVLQFAVPFFLLLFRRFKQSPGASAVLAGALLAAHALDVYWMVLPSLHPNGPALHWTSLTALVGIGGIAFGAGVWRAQGQYGLPVREPYLFHSLKVPLR